MRRAAGAEPGGEAVGRVGGGDGRGDAGEADAERAARSVRAAYLRVRRAEIERLGEVTGDVAPWLGEAIAWARRARALVGAFPEDARSSLGPLAPEERGRWLTALVGSPAAAWPLGVIASVPESALAEALTRLARRIPPGAWTWRDVEAAALGREGALRRAAASWSGALDAGRAAALALAIARVPPDPEALAEVERRSGAPAPLVLAAADALRLLGQYGRARSLVLRPGIQTGGGRRRSPRRCCGGRAISSWPRGRRGRRSRRAPIPRAGRGRWWPGSCSIEGRSTRPCALCGGGAGR